MNILLKTLTGLLQLGVGGVVSDGDLLTTAIIGGSELVSGWPIKLRHCRDCNTDMFYAWNVE